LAEHVAGEQLERGVEVAGLLGRRLAQQRLERGAVAGAHRRLVAEVLEMVDDEIDDAVPEAAQLVRRQREAVVHRRAIVPLPGWPSARSSRAATARCSRAPSSASSSCWTDRVAIEVTHITDPGCPWAYSARPAHAALRFRYGDALTWRLVFIGLTEEASQYEA